MSTKSSQVKWSFSALEDEALYQMQCHWRRYSPDMPGMRAIFWSQYPALRRIYLDSAIVMRQLGLVDTGPPQCVMAYDAGAEGVR